MQDQRLLNEFERAILSEILLNPLTYDEICDDINASDFSFELHAHMFRAFGALKLKNLSITSELVCEEMQKSLPKVTIDDITLIQRSLPIGKVDDYIRQVKEHSIKQKLIMLSNHIREQSIRDEVYAAQILSEAEKKIYELGMNTYQEDFKTLDIVAQSTMQLIIDNKRKMGAVKGIDTGFRELNIATTGFNAGELVIIGARPSMGKTALILSMALKAISAEKGVAFFSLEMPSEQIMLRMISARSRIPLQVLRSGDMSDKEIENLQMAMNDIVEHKNFYIDDNPHLTLNGLRSKLRKLKNKDSSISIVFIDYLQLMSEVKGMRESARHEIVSEISRGLKLLARELDMPIIALSQLNRSLDSRDDKRPILSDLRESGAIEQDADIILFLYRDEVYKERESKQRIARARSAKNRGDNNQEIEEPYKAPPKEEAELIIAKNRNGETKTVNVYFNKRYTLFEDKDEDKDMARAESVRYDDGAMPNF